MLDQVLFNFYFQSFRFVIEWHQLHFAICRVHSFHLSLNLKFFQKCKRENIRNDVRKYLQSKHKYLISFTQNTQHNMFDKFHDGKLNHQFPMISSWLRRISAGIYPKNLNLVPYIEASGLAYHARKSSFKKSVENVEKKIYLLWALHKFKSIDNSLAHI